MRDIEALQARIAELERQLAEAYRAIYVLATVITELDKQLHEAIDAARKETR